MLYVIYKTYIFKFIHEIILVFLYKERGKLQWIIEIKMQSQGIFGSWTKVIMISEENQKVKRNKIDHYWFFFLMLKRNYLSLFFGLKEMVVMTFWAKNPMTQVIKRNGLLLAQKKYYKHKKRKQHKRLHSVHCIGAASLLNSERQWLGKHLTQLSQKPLCDTFWKVNGISPVFSIAILWFKIHI